MTVYRDSDIDSLRLENTAVVLGGFDAMHRGHTAIIEKAVKCARENRFSSLVYMFENNPATIICGKQIKAVNTFEKRLEILEKLGVDIVVAEKFDKRIMDTDSKAFIKDYIKDRFGAKFVFAGFNYRFGRYGEGDAKSLESECGKYGISVYIEPEFSLGGKTVSSTRIRELISDGDVEDAWNLLGRRFSITGEVVKGNGIGRSELGFPTANIEFPDNCIVPKQGVYITQVLLDGIGYPAITNVGDKPTVEKNYTCIETYVIDKSFGNLYDKVIDVEFCKYIRAIKGRKQIKVR